METRSYRAEDLGPLARMGVLAFGGSVAAWEKYYERMRTNLVNYPAEKQKFGAEAGLKQKASGEWHSTRYESVSGSPGRAPVW